MAKKSTLCLWVDGIGLSSSWSGNAFMSSNPKNFLNAWSQYRRTTVSPCFNLKSGSENKEIDFARVNGAEDYPSNKVFLDQYIDKNRLEGNKELKKVIEETSERNAAFHLIGNIPSESEAYSSFAHLGALIECLCSNKKIQIYIHLILGDDLKNDQESMVKCLTQYYDLIKKYPLIETASISGQSNFSDNNLNRKVIEAIIFGRGIPSLTLEQAFSSQKDQLAHNKAPTSIIYRDKFSFKIKNFDTIIFFNHNVSFLSSFIQLITAELIGSLLMPKFLQTVTFFDPLYKQNNKIISLIERTFDDKLLSSLNGQYDLTIIADETGIDNLSYLGENYDYRIIKFDNYELVFENLPNILKGENKLALAYVNLLSKIPSDNNFKKTEDIAQEFDKFLGMVMELTDKNDYQLILFSSMAGLERLTNRSTIEKISNKTISPLPFIVINKGEKKPVSSKVMFYDMIKDRQSLANIAPTILDLLGIENEDKFETKSFNKEIK
jgi:bisphosphoglycerate-independent phosphoglycerate mutase (AlkP superfamily)